MWQFYELGALFTSATQDVVDKFAIVRNNSIDTLVATFDRTALFLLATIVIGALGFLGGLRFFFNWEVILFAPLTVIVSLLWTYILRNVEVMTVATLFYLAPLLYFFIDSHLLHMHFTMPQAAGVLLLVAGGAAFALDGQTFRLKPELTGMVWCALGFTALYNGAEAYFFKYLNSTYSVNGVSFYASLWALSTAYLLLVVLARGKGRLVVDKTSRAYLPRVAISKTCDATSSVLSAQALSLAAVSQVSALDCVYPLISFALVTLAQRGLKMRLNERLQVGNLVWKGGAVVLLAAGSFLVA
jgi:drug/metabolite transporter (DMT)-like permease